MQLTAGPAPILKDYWDELGSNREHKQSDAVREYDARRCHVCQGRYPAFGFGTPLMRNGKTIWACGSHRTEVERMLTRSTLLPLEKSPPTLL